MAEPSPAFTAPWYPWYVRDVLTAESCEALSLAEEGAYRRALDKAWMNGSIPANPKDLAAAIGKRCTVKIAKIVLSRFVKMPGHPKRMVNLKQERVRMEQKEKYDKKVKAGEARAAQRAAEKLALEASKDGHSASTATASLEHRTSYTETEQNKKEEEEREEMPPKATTKKGTRLPDAFLLTKSMREWAADRRPDVDLALETEKFCNHFRSAPGQKGVKLDWELTWKNWILNSQGKSYQPVKLASDIGKSTTPEHQPRCPDCNDTGMIFVPVPEGLQTITGQVNPQPCECRSMKAA